MDSQHYRVILKGELLPGYSQEIAVATLAEIFQTPGSNLREVFDGAERPVNQPLTAEEALELQSRLERIGVRCRVERMPDKNINLQLRSANLPNLRGNAITRASDEAGLMHCPACGHEQLVSNRCESCGVVFADYNRRARQVGAAPAGAGSSVPPESPHMPSNEAPPQQPVPPMQDDWRNEWVDTEEAYEPDERSYLALFFGEQPETYLRQCERHLSGPRTRFALSWNWGAVFSPFVWALYRKLWGWASLIFIAEVFLPVLLIIIGSYELASPKWAYVGYAGFVANRLFWPALANFIYCRHARITLQRLHMMSPNYAAEIDIATAGGVSHSSVLVGLVVAGVMSVFLWSVVDSVHESSRVALQPKVLDFMEAELSGSEPSFATSGGRLVGAENATENKWTGTRRKLRTLGNRVNTWLAENAGASTAQLNMFRLREELGLKGEMLTDGWGGQVQYIPDNEGYRLISAGPDRLFGTADDIQYRRVMAE